MCVPGMIVARLGYRMGMSSMIMVRLWLRRCMFVSVMVVLRLGGCMIMSGVCRRLIMRCRCFIVMLFRANQVGNDPLLEAQQTENE